MYKASRKYGLYQPDAAVFEALCYLCKNTGECKISYEKLGEFARVHKTTCYNSVKELINRGLVFQIGTGAFQIRTETFQIGTISKEERTKEENININKSLPAIKKEPSDGWLAGFNLFWEKYNPSGEFVRRKDACKQLWQKMPNDWRHLATERAADHDPARNPLFYLRDEDFLKVGKPEQKAAPEWLDHEQQYQLLQGGAELVFCKRPDGKGFGTVTKADAERFQLQKVRDVTLNY